MDKIRSDFSFKQLFTPLTSRKAVLIIVFVGLLVFFNGLFNGFVVDDQSQILNNRLVHSVGNIPKLFSGSTFYQGGNLGGVNYRPLMTSSFALIYSLFGANSLPFHFVSLVFHILNTLLIFAVFRYFLPKIQAFLLALVFLVHPINSEVVYYISNLQDLLFLFFGLLALWIIQLTKSSKQGLLVSSLCLLFSFFSKETGLLFIPIILLFKYFFDKKFLATTIFYMSLAILLYLFLRFNALGLQAVPHGSSMVSLGFAERLINVPAVIFFYLKTFIFPNELSYSWNWVVKNLDLQNFWVPLAAVLAAALLFFRAGLTVYDKSHNKFKVFVFFLVVFTASLILHIQIFPLDQTVADRWFYLPIIGLLGVIALFIDSYSKKYSSNPISFILIIVIIILSVRTYSRGQDWKDEYTLSKHDSSISVDDFVIEDSLAFSLFKQEKYEEAKVHAQKSVGLNPNAFNVNLLGQIYLATGDLEKAEELYLRSIRLGDYYATYQNLVVLKLAYKEPKDAQEFTKKALNKFPNDPKLWLYYSVIEYKLDNLSAARIGIKKAYDLDSSDSNIIYVYSRLRNNQPLQINFTIQ